MDFVKLKKFNFLKKEVEERGQQSKNLDCENRRLENKIETLKDPNDVCKCIIALSSFSINRVKIDQAISVVLCKLAKKNIGRFQSGGVKARLNNAIIPSYLK